MSVKIKFHPIQQTFTDGCEDVDRLAGHNPIFPIDFSDRQITITTELNTRVMFGLMGTIACSDGTDAMNTTSNSNRPYNELKRPNRHSHRYAVKSKLVS